MQEEAKILEFQKFKRKKELSKRDEQFQELEVHDLLAESEKLLRALEIAPLNAEIAKRSQLLIKEIMHRLGNFDDMIPFQESHYVADEKLKAIQPYL